MVRVLVRLDLNFYNFTYSALHDQLPPNSKNNAFTQYLSYALAISTYVCMYVYSIMAMHHLGYGPLQSAN